jgi:hypothetical protein
LVTVARANGRREVLDDQTSKLVRVPAWRGAMAYWGLARLGNYWNTLEWLREQVAQAGSRGSPEEFASALAANLNAELGRRTFRRPVDSGIGIHFTVYEHVGGYWIPELFLISNWTDTSYSSVRLSDVRVTRETYATLKRLADRPQVWTETGYRLEVHSALHKNGVMFRFNNGDPELYNPVANSIMGTFTTLFNRRLIRDPVSVQTHLSLVRRPVEVISKLLADLAKPEFRLIGGKTHDLAISPNGDYISNSGD